MLPKHMKDIYNRYISSPEWKKKREEAMRLALFQGEYRCEVCGWDFPKEKLEVHHKTYERLCRERTSDLMVVCGRCHKKQDEIRAKKSKERSEQALEEAQLDGWASKVYGEDWAGNVDEDHIAEKFENWLWKKGEY